MRKGIEVLRVFIVPAEVRRGAPGESFKSLIRVGVAKTARDGVDYFQGETTEVLCGINPRIAELSRELLDLVANELAEQNDGQLIYVVDGPNAKTDFTTYDAAERSRVASKAAEASQRSPAPPIGARPSEASLDRVRTDAHGVPRLVTDDDHFAPPLVTPPANSSTSDASHDSEPATAAEAPSAPPGAPETEGAPE